MDRLWKGCVNVDKIALKWGISEVERVFHYFVHLSTKYAHWGVNRVSYKQFYQQYVDNFIHRVFKSNVWKILVFILK